jgi:hypothetical protein
MTVSSFNGPCSGELFGATELRSVCAECKLSGYLVTNQVAGGRISLGLPLIRNHLKHLPYPVFRRSQVVAGVLRDSASHTFSAASIRLESSA